MWLLSPPGDADQENKDLWPQLEKKLQELRGEMGAKRRRVILASPEAAAKTAAYFASNSGKSCRVAGPLTKVMMTRRFRARAGAKLHLIFCLPTSRVGVFLQRNSLCISVTTTTLCHLLIHERNSNVESFFFFARQGRRSFFAAASPSAKSVKGSQGGVLVAARSSLQLGAIVANVDDHEVEWRGHDWVACVVKAESSPYVDVTAFMTSTADARCLENVSKLRQISVFAAQTEA